jgi:integrin alpha FG-GAP repeat containing protein 1
LVCDRGGGAKSFQIWINNKEEGFSLAQEGPLPRNTQAITFADIGKLRQPLVSVP